MLADMTIKFYAGPAFICKHTDKIKEIKIFDTKSCSNKDCQQYGRYLSDLFCGKCGFKSNIVPTEHLSIKDEIESFKSKSDMFRYRFDNADYHLAEESVYGSNKRTYYVDRFQSKVHHIMPQCIPEEIEEFKSLYREDYKELQDLYGEENVGFDWILMCISY